MTERWERKHKALFTAAARHPFIKAVRDGAVPFSSFKAYLGQEHWLARNAIVPFLSNLLPESNVDASLIQTGIRFRNADQIPCLEKEANNADDPQQPTRDLSKFLRGLVGPEANYAVGLAVLWAMETVYHRGFSHCLGDDSRAAAEMKEACRKWGNEWFGNYCLSLQSAADRALAEVSDDVVAKAEVAVLQLLEIVVEVWNANMRTMQPNAV
ncbi:unnamed protein product [Cuscuta campestris]|uniref:Thiaminase-2/PQQC domain-containing protein n=1 Tax=Cuscuta campestris TaxID=132261 RepID=A0A484LUV6_9ASTE|nr:unnamed protein product [Cuscuta campestris]